jgi:hypothetical protein
MKKLLVAILAVALFSFPALAANGGGKKKAKKKARTECKNTKSSEVKKCDPQNCDPQCCDPKCCDFSAGAAEAKCSPAPSCAAHK